MALTRSDENRHDFAFIAGVIIGAISGALVTLALTPMSGADTREKLRSRAGELGPMRDRAMEAAAPVKEKAMNAAAPVKEKAGSIATTAAEKSKSLAATGKERASELAAKTPLGRGSHDANDIDTSDVNEMLFGSDPNAGPGGTVTPSALADAGAEAVSDTAESAASDVAATTESGNGRVSETPSGGARPDNG